MARHIRKKVEGFAAQQTKPQPIQHSKPIQQMKPTKPNNTHHPAPNHKESFKAPIVAPVQSVSSGGKAGITIGVLLFLILALLVYFFIIRKKRGGSMF